MIFLLTLCSYICNDLCILVVLWSGGFVVWIELLTRDKVHPYSWMDCKVGFFLFYFGRHYSSIILVLMSVEKCFAVYFPLKSKSVCTVRTAKWATGIVGFILAGYNVHWFVIVESQVSKTTGRDSCVPTKYFHDAFNLATSIIYSFAPFIFMFITNFAIVFKFIRAKYNRSNSTESTNQALVKAATRGTAMVVIVSVTFLLLTAPTAVYNAVYRWYPITIFFPLYYPFMNLTQYLNHSINGVLYIIVGSKFRNEFMKLRSSKERSDTPSVSRSFTNTSLRFISTSGN